MNDFNNCNEIRCLISKPLCCDGKCYEECPSSYVANNSVCISTGICKEAGWKVYKKTCVRTCPAFTRPFSEYLGSPVSGCEDVLLIGIFTAIAAVFLTVITVACIRLLRNPEKPMKKERQPLDEDEDQTEVVRIAPAVMESCVRGQPVNATDTSLKEVVDWIQPMHTAVSAVNEIPEVTSAKCISQWNDDHMDFEQYVREDDEFSSVPTIVAIKGFQSSENSMDPSLCETHSD